MLMGLCFYYCFCFTVGLTFLKFFLRGVVFSEFFEKEKKILFFIPLLQFYNFFKRIEGLKVLKKLNVGFSIVVSSLYCLMILGFLVFPCFFRDLFFVFDYLLELFVFAKIFFIGIYALGLFFLVKKFGFKRCFYLIVVHFISVIFDFFSLVFFVLSLKFL